MLISFALISPRTLIRVLGESRKIIIIIDFALSVCFCFNLSIAK